MLGNAGAHPVSYVPLNNGYRIMTTVYDIPAAHVRIRAAFTNTMPTATYRGAGRPESHFVLERLIDMAAARLGIDRLEIRRRNLIRREQLPYRTAMGLTYDSGDFRGNMGQRRGARRLERRQGAQDARRASAASASASASRAMWRRRSARRTSACASRCATARSTCMPARNRPGRGTRRPSRRCWRTASASRRISSG